MANEKLCTCYNKLYCALHSEMICLIKPAIESLISVPSSAALTWMSFASISPSVLLDVVIIEFRRHIAKTLPLAYRPVVRLNNQEILGSLIPAAVRNE